MNNDKAIIEISKEELKGLKAFNLGIETMRPELSLLSDCVLMLDSYLANDEQMDEALLQKALKIADIYTTRKALEDDAFCSDSK